jgi:hypothetical protein
MNVARSVSIKTLALVLLCGVLAGGTYGYDTYISFVRARVYAIRYSALGENDNLFFCLRYWFDFVGKLRLNAAGLSRVLPFD